MLLSLGVPVAAEEVRRPDPAADTTVGQRDLTPSRAEFSALEGQARSQGRVRVIVGLQTRFVPEGHLGDRPARAQRRSIDVQQDRVLEALDGSGARVLHRYDAIPAIALELPVQAVQALQRSGRAATITEDVEFEPTLAQSAGIVQADQMWGRSPPVTGAGQVIAIVDSGVEKAHPFFARQGGGSRVVEEACYVTGTTCPDGTTASTATGSGEPCTASGCDHGTHVAGIAAGKSATSAGIAPGADLMSIRVFRLTTATAARA
jgi:subtilisin